MAIHHLPPRPTIANPVNAREQIGKCVTEIDENVDLLFCIYGTLAGSTEVPEEALEALSTIHKRLRRQCDALFAVT